MNNLTTAQNCGIELLEEQVQYMNDTRIDRANTSVSLFSDEDEIVDFQIAAHIVRDSNGEQGMSLDDLNSAINELNETYEPVGFRFQICKIDYIDDDHYANGGVAIAYNGSSIEYQMALPYIVPDAIDIFFVPVLSNPYHNGWSSFPSYINYYGKDWTVVKNSAANNGSTLAHEMGHYFSLYHTHDSTQGRELVNRTTGCGPGIGDDLCDTPADPTGIAYNEQGDRYQIGYCTNYSTCEFDGSDIEHGCNLTDSNGDEYRPDTKNVMSYNTPECRIQFSPQQIARMQRSYLYERDYLNNYCEVTCGNMFVVYDWLENVTCQNNASTDITIYKYSQELNYVDIQSGNERNLYSSEGDLVCSGSAVENCIAVQIGLTEILAECNKPCDNTCTDVNACNFGETGNCIFGNINCPDPCNTSDCIFGCTNPIACNYNPEATVNDNTCYFGNLACPIPCDDNSCYGCTDSSACNFDSAATKDDDSCEYGNSECPDPCDESSCNGQPCTLIFEQYPWLNNYTSLGMCTKIVDYYDGSYWHYVYVQSGNKGTIYLDYDGSGISYGTDNGDQSLPQSFGLSIFDQCDCGEQSSILGCTDAEACNYNPQANEDDGSCYDCPQTPGSACNGAIDTYAWLSNYITSSTCTKIVDYYDGSYWHYVYVQSGNEGTLYLDYDGNGINYGTDNGDQSLPQSFGLSIFDQWECGCGGSPSTICEDPTACNYGETNPCEFGNQECLDPCDEDTCANCENYTGTIFYADCSGTTYRFVETDDGHIYDPYFDLVDLEIYDGQRIRFDFIDNDEVSTPCEVAEKAITITCIEEIEVESEGCDNVFEDYPRLLNEVDPNNCTSESITIYLHGDYYTFIYIDRGENGDLYLDTTWYGSDAGDFSATVNYDLVETAQWTCGCNFSNSVAKTSDLTDKNLKTTGLMDANAFTIYPNPTKGGVNIELADDIEFKALPNTITVYETNGRVMHQSTFADSRTKVNLSDLPKGMYMLEIQSAQHISIQKLLIE